MKKRASIASRVAQIGVMAAFVAFAGFASHGAEHRFTVTLNAGNAAAENVPVALRLSPSLVRGFDYATAGDGTHFEILDEAGAILPYEIDTWNPGGESLLWVKVPFFVKDRKLTVIYGHTNKDMTNAAQVWSNYIGVWHMNAVNADGKYPNSTGDTRFDGEVSSFSRTGEAGRFGQSVQIFTNAMHSLNNVPEAKERGGVFIPDGGSLVLANDFAVSGWFYHATVDNPAVNGTDKTYAFRFDTLFCKRKHPKANNALNGNSRGGFSLRVNENKSASENLVVNGRSDGDNPVLLPRQIMNGAWQHLTLSFEAERRPATWLDGVCVTNHTGETIIDNDEPLVIGNTSAAYPDAEGNRAWGGYADEVRIHRGAPSDVYLAAEYAAMVNNHEYGAETCSLTIDKNEHFDDSVTISSDVPAFVNGEYYAGTTITLTANAGATGTFRKWYGDVPRESCTNATVSFVIERDSWIYARFVHPWTLSTDKTTMTDGNFKVNVTDANETKHTLTVGRVVTDPVGPGLLADGDTGSGVIDLGGPILKSGDETPWTVTKFAAGKSSQVVSTNHVGEVRAYISPGTVTVNNGTQILHCGDDREKEGVFPYASSYKMIILDEPAMTAAFNTYLIANQTKLDVLVLELPRVSSTAVRCERTFYGIPLGGTKFDWWDLSSLSILTNAFFAASWAPNGIYEMYRRAAAKGELSLPNLRGVDWLSGEGTQLYLMRGIEGISLGGKDEETTVTNLCTYAFAGDSSLRRLTLHAAPDIRIGQRIFADHTYNATNGLEIIDEVSYLIGDKTLKGRVPDEIHFTGQAISSEAIENLLDACPVVSTAAKQVAIYASRFQDGWKENRRDWISNPTPAERAAYAGQRVLGVYRAGAEAPSGKAVILHRGNDWDKGTNPGLFIRMR